MLLSSCMRDCWRGDESEYDLTRVLDANVVMNYDSGLVLGGGDMRCLPSVLLRYPVSWNLIGGVHEFPTHGFFSNYVCSACDIL